MMLVILLLLLRVMIASSLLLLRWHHLLTLLLLLLLWRVWRLWCQWVTTVDFHLFLQVVVIFSGCLSLIVGHHLRCLLGYHSLAPRHHSLHSLWTTYSRIDQGALRTHSRCCTNLGLWAGRLLHWGLKVVHVAGRLVNLLDRRYLVSAFWTLRNIKVASWLYLNLNFEICDLRINHVRARSLKYQHRSHLAHVASPASSSYL
jgi:hypothetical protein